MFAGKKVTEFLLVPWVGACIHTPPPPPNQIVHVKLKKASEMEHRFAPIFVKGEMKVSSSEQELFLFDGSDVIDSAYLISEAVITPYK